MTPVTLVTGPRAAARESAIARELAVASSSGKQPIAVILEGLPDGSGLLEDHSPDLQLAQLVRIAPGCVCCTGNVVLRVTLNRILRHPPAHLYIGLADITHLDRIRRFLNEPPYDRLLALTDDLPA